MRKATALGVLALAMTLSCARAKPNVILITVDALRADHLGVYGYSKATSPSIDDFAQGATVFQNAVAQAPHTIPSLLQIMTSRYRIGDEVEPNETTVAEVLRKSGYETAAIVDNPLLELHPTARGLMKGFDVFYRNGVLDWDAEQQHWKTKTPGDCITAQARRWLTRRKGSRPFFLWVHYFDPHDPYMPPFADDLEMLSRGSASAYTGDVRNTFLFRGGDKPAQPFSEGDRQHLIDLYDAEVRYADQAIGEFLDGLKASGWYDDALIILTADHGESLGEHGVWTHGRSLYDPEIHIPIILKAPRQAYGARIKDAVEAIDVFPTILEILALPLNGLSLDGVSLLQPHARPAFAFWKGWQVVRGVEWKLLQHGDKTELFRLPDDPGEARDESESEPAMVADLVAAQTARLDDLKVSKNKLDSISSETVERLRALGYLPR